MRSVPGAVAGGWYSRPLWKYEFCGVAEYWNRLCSKWFCCFQQRLAQDFEEQGQNLNDAGRDLYLPNSNPPKVGSLLRNPQLANSLEIVADQGKEGFYNGSIAQKLSAFITEQGATCVRVILPHILQHESLL